MRAAVAAGLALAALVPAAGAAPDVRMLEGRIAALEQRVAQQGASPAAYGQVQLVTQLQQLQEEVRTLRGQVEENANLLQQLQKRQRDLYLDLDRRLAALEGGAPPAGSGAGMATPPAAPGMPGGVLPPAPPGPAAPAGPPPAVGAAPAVPPASAPPSGAGATASPTPAAADEQTLYRTAYEELRAGRYEAAIGGFRTLLASYPRGDLADNAQYWIGESYYVTRQYDQALPEFEKVVSGFPQSPKAADAQLKIGFVHYNRRDFARAREALEAVVRNWPMTPAARLAQSQLQRMQQEGT